ncbi:hypothetical protein AMAG_07844 [Allomyces macrogynus ATCC 38327]|uniref:Succinate dehydrogenase [ubiquinone] cytochrome b small subunit n=1 Tax=Allomyces macrogynus (strain ATCC 38327) TaxID=578462 RepID=A0A0L0SJS0_ALLM3|nr:hypothetical protein AMAG_07844 [Allomyces macrogynus ATCC 38327]|eukprot:KNE62650.1 hypothetical protein AMAG_07844 [Allomyces macrogynus ATCC 38327]
MLAVRQFAAHRAAPMARLSLQTAARARMASTQAAEHAGSRMHGSTHWAIERYLSLALLPATGYALFVGSSAANDYLLAGLLTAHSHLGFDQVITDYLPKRRSPGAYTAATWGLRAATLAVLIGCIKINSGDVGLTETFRRIWRAPVEAKKLQDAKKAE